MEQREVALVTGGAAGIGLAISHKLAARGAYVAVLDINQKAAAKVVRGLGAGNGVALAADVSSSASVAAAVRRLTEITGHLDTVIANAGVEIRGTVEEIDEALWHRGIAINLTGVFLTARHTIPLLGKSARGSLVVMSSDSGLRGTMGWPAYSATKHAVIGLMKSMALDHGPQGIRINAVCPGWVKTPLMERSVEPARIAGIEASNPVGRVAAPEDVAAIVAHLTAVETKHTHGMVYAVDGGSTAGSFKAPEKGPSSSEVRSFE